MQRRQLMAGLLAWPLLPAQSAQAATVASPPRLIGTTPGPHAEILAQVRPIAASAGLDLRIVVREGGLGINADVAAGRLDAACFQDGVSFAGEARSQLIAAAATVCLPMALYSRRLTSPKQLKDGDTVALPRGAAGTARALVLLQNYGLIGLREGSGLQAGLRDVVGNRRRLRFVQMRGDGLAGALAKVALAVIDSVDAARAGLEPARDSIGLEDGRSPYAGVLAVRRDQAGAPWVAQLLRAYRSEPMQRFLLEHYRDSVRRPW